MGIHIPPALHHRRFTLLWLGQMISVAGSQMQIWALYWHIRELNSNPIAVSGIGAARFIPILVFALIGGLFADRYNRRKIIFFTQSTMALTALGLWLLTWLGVIQLWHIYLLTAVQAVAISFDGPSRQSLIPNLVPAKDLPSAFSMQSIAGDIGSIVGPALSGLVIAYMGQQSAYLINAVSFLAVIAALVMIGTVPQQVNLAPTQKRIDLSPIGEGIRFIVKHPIISSSMILDFFATFFSSANTLLPYVARDILHVGAIQYGWLSAAQSIGAIGAALIISQKSKIRKQGKLLLGAVVIFGLATVAFGISRAFVFTFAALMVVGAADSVSTIIRNTVRQMQTPDHIRGRMTSINQIFFMGGPQLGEIESGAVAQAFGIPAAIITGGIGCVVAAVWIAGKFPQIRNYNGDEPTLAGATAD